MIEDPEAFAELLDIIWEGMTRRAGSGTFVTDYQRVGRHVIELLTAPLRAAGTVTIQASTLVDI